MIARRPKQVRGHAGFSFIEVLVAMGVAVVLAAIAAPNLGAFQRQYNLAGAANQVAFDIARARMQAIGQNVTTRVVIVSNSSYRFERSTNGVTFVADGATTTLPAGIRLTGEAGPTFNRNGLATTATTLTLTNDYSTKTVRTNIIGRVTIS